MKSMWGRKLTLPVVTVLVFWVSTGCEGTPELTEEEMIISSMEDGEYEGEDIASQARANTEERDSTAWPEGWLVVQHEEWIPVLDDLGRHLHSARESFQDGQQRAAIYNIQLGINFLEARVSDANDRDRAALESAIATLSAITNRLSEDEEVTLEQLDIALANAYRSELETEGLIVQTGSTVPYHEQPERHLQLALERFVAEETEEAARELERASAFLRLEGNRRDPATRVQLITAAQDLEHLAARVRILEIRDRTELDREIVTARLQWRRLTRTSTVNPS